MIGDDEIKVIRTIECDLCYKFDSILLSKTEVIKRTKLTDMGIGAFSVKHGDHTRIVYFDEDANYLGDTIAERDVSL